MFARRFIVKFRLKVNPIPISVVALRYNLI